MPRVSIIIPVYNCEKFLSRCLNSIINQTYKDFEVILVDDCSKDNSMNILLEYEKKYSNIKVVKNKKNMGPGASRNKGIGLAKGKYILFVDSDDYIEPNTLEDTVKCADKYNADVVRFDFSRCISNIKCADRKLYPKQKEKVKKVSSFDKDYILLETAGPCNKLFLKSLIGESRFPEGIYFEDLPFIISNIIKAKNIIHLNEVLYRYTFNPKSIMGSNLSFNTKILDIFTSCDILDKYIEKLDYNKDYLNSLKLMNCIYIFNDILLWKKLKHKQKSMLCSYLYRIIQLKYGDIFSNELYLKIECEDFLFRKRMKYMRKFILKQEYMNCDNIDDLLCKVSNIIKGY